MRVVRPLTRVRPTRRRGREGQTLVEFAMVFPVVMILCMGLMSSAWLFFQKSAATNGARGGARLASIEPSLVDSSGEGGAKCVGGSSNTYQDEGESGIADPSVPGGYVTIAYAVQHATTQLAVNPAWMCLKATGVDTCVPAIQPGGTCNTMIQKSTMSNAANVTAVLQWDGATPRALKDVTVTVTTTVRGLAPPLNSTYTISASSDMPTLIGY